MKMNNPHLPPQETVKTTGRFKSFDGTQIYYEVRGSGPPLVLCYGLACSMSHWRHQIKYFSNRYQVITFDYRGHHKSDRPKNLLHQNIPALAKDLQHLVKHLSLPPASFWAHSFGGQVLLQTYSDSPSLFANMILINTFANNPIREVFGNHWLFEVFRILKNGYRQRPHVFSLIWRWSTNNVLAHYLSAFLGGFNLQLTSLRDIEVYSRGVSSIHIEHFIALFEEMMSFRGEPLLDRVNVPTLIIGGKKDSITPLPHQYLLHDRIKQSELLEVPYGSHCCQLDMPEFVNLRIEKFLTQNQY